MPYIFIMSGILDHLVKIGNKARKPKGRKTQKERMNEHRFLSHIDLGLKS